MFHLGTDEIYGINVFKIREVMKMPAVTKIPDSDPRILGVVNLRGENIALVDLKQAIGLGSLERGKRQTHYHGIQRGINRGSLSQELTALFVCLGSASRFRLR